MENSPPSEAATAGGISRFELAPPRRFILPAILLLLSERPGYGYGLVPRLQEFHFGHVDRPAVYRALAQLEGDGLLEASSQNPKAGQSRRVYRVTPLGEQILRGWMGVIKEEQDHLGGVLRRYQATGRADAGLAEVSGGWAAPLGVGWSAPPPLPAPRRLITVDAPPEWGSDATAAMGPRSLQIISDRSVVLIEVRSTVGPLSFGAAGLTGSIQAEVVDGVLCTEVAPTAQLEIDVTGLRSGNSLYDAELRRRIDARRFPKATVDLSESAPTGPGHRYRLKGALTFHGVTRPAQGTVRVDTVSDHQMVITGEQVFDIRDFAIPSPTVLMLRIYPDVRVRLHVEAELREAG